jgi:hypothetical protein
MTNLKLTLNRWSKRGAIQRNDRLREKSSCDATLEKSETSGDYDEIHGKVQQI